MPRYLRALIPLTVALLMTGCHSSEAFNTSLRHATTDISQGRLGQARTSLFEADSLASDSAERQKVRDLTAVVDGAEAMIDGDSAGAAAAWSNVEDVSLRRQLQQEAEAMGLEINPSNQEDTR